MSDALVNAVDPNPADPQPASVQPDPHAVDAMLAAWINGHVRGTPIAQHTAAWNHLMTHALPALSRLLKGA